MKNISFINNNVRTMVKRSTMGAYGTLYFDPDSTCKVLMEGFYIALSMDVTKDNL